MSTSTTSSTLSWRSWAQYPSQLQRWLFGGTDEDESQPTARAYILFGAASLSYLAFSFWRQSENFVRGQMWAEMGTNYYRVVVTGSIFDKLFGTDAGYIPLPQRLIAVVADLLGLPPTAFPYYFASVAWVLAALMLASVALPTFRVLLPNDGLRFVLALAFIVVPDFESRLFLSFTYFAIVPIVLVTALAWVRPHSAVPAWAWPIPIFLVSKPVALSVLPMMVVVALVSGGRFRRITVVSVAAGIVQLGALAVNFLTGGSLAQQYDSSTLDRVLAGAKHFFALTARFLVSPDLAFADTIQTVLGVGILIVVFVIALRVRTPAAALIYVSLVTFAFICILNSFTFARDFSRDAPLLHIEVLDRRFIIGVFAGMMIVAALVTFATQSRVCRALLSRLPGAGPRIVSALLPGVLLLGWLLAGGWPAYAIRANPPLVPPLGLLSLWEQSSADLESPGGSACVPLDPWGWAYLENCAALFATNPSGMQWHPAGGLSDPDGAIEVPIPEAVEGRRILSLAVLVMPDLYGPVSGRLILEGRMGSTLGEASVTVPTSSIVSTNGGLLQFAIPDDVEIGDITSCTIRFDSATRVALAGPAGETEPMVMWFGQ